MAVTPSNMLPLGTKAPDFTLLDTHSGKMISLADCKSDIATVVMFICNHCPYVIHIQDEIINVANVYERKGVKFVAISSNDVESYPEDAPHLMTKRAKSLNFSFPYCYDETQDIAKAYHAACTPDFYIFDNHLACVYRGQFDDSRPGKSTPVTGKSLTNALDNIIAGNPVDGDQKPSHGCNIKWKS